MKSFPFWRFFSLACLIAATQAHADTWTADFGSAILDPNLALNQPSEWTVTSGGGGLDFNSTGNTAALTSSFVRYKQFISGDFTATVTVDISQGYNIVSSLVFAPATGSLSTNTSVYKSNSPTNLARLGGFNPVTNSFPPNLGGLDSILTVEINRTGNVFTESYKSLTDSGFTSFFSFDASMWNGLGGYIYLSARQSQPAAINADVKFSNFSVTTPVPEPETYALVLAGLGMLGFVARRKKQTVA